MTSEPFTPRCSKAPFSEEELDILRQYGAAFERLSNGERTPATVAQKQFVDAVRGKRPPGDRLRTRLDEIPHEARMGERPHQPGSNGGAPANAGRSRGLETHARSNRERG